MPQDQELSRETLALLLPAAASKFMSYKKQLRIFLLHLSAV